jgi:hypothetical protein
MSLWQLDQLIEKSGPTVIWNAPWRGPCPSVELIFIKKRRTWSMLYAAGACPSLSVREIDTLGSLFQWDHNRACWNTIQPKSLSLRVWSHLCYINHLHLWHLSNVRLDLFILTRVYSTISSSRVSPSPYCYTLPQIEVFFLKKKLKIYQSYAPSLGSLVGYVGLLASCTFALTLGTHFCLCHESLLLTLETLVHTRTLHFCPYFRDPLYVPAPLHHVTHHHLSFDTTC